jgi:hypothetical protein
MTAIVISLAALLVGVAVGFVAAVFLILGTVSLQSLEEREASW